VTDTATTEATFDLEAAISQRITEAHAAEEEATRAQQERDRMLRDRAIERLRGRIEQRVSPALLNALHLEYQTEDEYGEIQVWAKFAYQGEQFVIYPFGDDSGWRISDTVGELCRLEGYEEKSGITLESRLLEALGYWRERAEERAKQEAARAEQTATKVEEEAAPPRTLLVDDSMCMVELSNQYGHYAEMTQLVAVGTFNGQLSLRRLSSAAHTVSDGKHRVAVDPAHIVLTPAEAKTLRQALEIFDQHYAKIAEERAQRAANDDVPF
jgi:hypothetical protein